MLWQQWVSSVCNRNDVAFVLKCLLSRGVRDTQRFANAHVLPSNLLWGDVVVWVRQFAIEDTAPVGCVCVGLALWKACSKPCRLPAVLEMDKYTIMGKIGEGTFSTVRSVSLHASRCVENGQASDTFLCVVHVFSLPCSARPSGATGEL